MIRILDSICALIASEFKSSPIYIDTMPQKFNRPSFYIELLNMQDRDGSTDTQTRELSFQINYFGAKDDFNNVSTIEQYSVMSTLQKLFYRTLEVDKKRRDYKKIDSVDFLIKDDIVIMTLRLKFEAIIEDNILSPEENKELMNEIKIKYMKQ